MEQWKQNSIYQHVMEWPSCEAALTFTFQSAQNIEGYSSWANSEPSPGECNHTNVIYMANARGYWNEMWTKDIGPQWDRAECAVGHICSPFGIVPGKVCLPRKFLEGVYSVALILVVMYPRRSGFTKIKKANNASLFVLFRLACTLGSWRDWITECRSGTRGKKIASITRYSTIRKKASITGVDHHWNQTTLVRQLTEKTDPLEVLAYDLEVLGPIVRVTSHLRNEG